MLALLFLRKQEDPAKDINVYINSPGGSVTAGMAIYDTMQFIKPDVGNSLYWTSMFNGSILLAGGTAGELALPHARVIHQPLGGFRGQASDVQIHARNFKKIKQTLNGAFSISYQDNLLNKLNKILILLIILCLQNEASVQFS